MQHLFAGVEAFFARGFRKGGQGAPGRTARAGLHQLGPVHGHAFLPVGTCAFVAVTEVIWSCISRSCAGSNSAWITAHTDVSFSSNRFVETHVNGFNFFQNIKRTVHNSLLEVTGSSAVAPTIPI